MKTVKGAHTILVLLTLTCFSYRVEAQSTRISERNVKMFSVEWLKPSFSGFPDVSFGTSVTYLSARLPLSNPKLMMVAELPYSNFSFKSTAYYSASGDATVGNPYVGLEFGEQDATVFTEIGLRFPLVSDEQPLAQINGFYSDYDRADAFVDHIVPFTIRFNSISRYGSGTFTHLSFGPQIWMVTNDESIDGGEADKFELFLTYGFHGGFDDGKVGVTGGFTGRFFVTQYDASFSEKSIHQFDLSVYGRFNNLRPGIFLRVPVDKDLEENLNSVLGLNLSFVLPGQADSENP